jgi:hypothetical protein
MWVPGEAAPYVFFNSMPRSLRSHNRAQAQWQWIEQSLVHRAFERPRTALRFERRW